jgi:broad specificity phosphatase PhoE
VRHGPVAAPHQGRLYGGSDVPLSDEGRAASLALAARLAADPPDAVWSSPLQRAAFLAQHLAALSGARLVLHPDLRELDRGAWTGLRRDELERRQPGALAAYVADPEGHAAPGGERESEILARVGAVLEQMAEREGGRRVVLVAHAHVLRAALRRLLGWDGPTSLQRFVPLLGVVEARVRAGGGEVLSLPGPLSQDALLRP